MKKFLSVMFLTLLTFLLIPNVNASVLEVDESELILRGNYNSSKFLFGLNVDNESTIDGISFIIGDSIKTKSAIDYGMYIGEYIYVSDSIEKDLFIVGSTVEIEEDAILRDAYIVGEEVVIKGEISGSLRVVASTLDLSDANISGSVYAEAGEVIITGATVVNGKLSINEDAIITGESTANFEIEKTEVAQTTSEITFSTVLSVIYSIVAGWIVLLVIMYIAPRLEEKTNNLDLSAGNIAKNVGFGAVIVIMVPILSVFCLLSEILMPLTLIVLCFYVILIYLSGLVSAYIVGDKILKKFNKETKTSVSALVGITIYTLICLIPVIGIVIGVIFRLYGFSYIYGIFKHESEEKVKKLG